MAPAPILSSFLFTSLLLLLFISPICSSPVNDEKVSMSLYYETLCPGCQYFITDKNGLIKLFNEHGLIDIVNLRFVPWGNAELKQNGTIVCQHGEDECYHNTIHACIINVLPDTIERFLMIYCTESVLANTVHRGSEVWRECAKTLQYPQEHIQKCYESGLGKQLELAYGEETKNLYPPLEYTPWVVVNGQPVRNYTDYIYYICKAYKGKNPPKICRDSVPRNKIADSSVARICARDDHYHQDSHKGPPLEVRPETAPSTLDSLHHQDLQQSPIEVHGEEPPSPLDSLDHQDLQQSPIEVHGEEPPSPLDSLDHQGLSQSPPVKVHGEEPPLPLDSLDHQDLSQSPPVKVHSQPPPSPLDLLSLIPKLKMKP